MTRAKGRVHRYGRDHLIARADALGVIDNTDKSTMLPADETIARIPESTGIADVVAVPFAA